MWAVAVSCWGRLHPNAEQMLMNLSQRVARRQGGVARCSVLMRFRAHITIELMRRAARMVLHCLPHAHAADAESVRLDHEAEPSLEAELRAGHSGHCRLPPLYPAPRRVAP